MKKKIFLIVFAILLTLILVACNSNTDKLKNDNIEFSTNLDEVYNTIIAKQPEEKKEELVLFKETNEELINSFYEGLSEVTLLEKNIYMHPVGAAYEIALVKTNNIDDVEKIENIFRARIQRGIDVAMCDSESQDIWRRRAEVQSKGQYICLIVLPDGYNIPEEIFALEI